MSKQGLETFNEIISSLRYKCHLKYSWTVPMPPVIAALASVVSGFSSSIQIQPRFDQGEQSQHLKKITVLVAASALFPSSCPLCFG